VRKSDGTTDEQSPNWEEIYAELRNKIRWAIGTTLAESGAINLGFREQTALAGPGAGAILEALKELYEKPNIRLAHSDGAVAD